MSCRDFERLIALNVEGDLGESERQRVEQHLRTCSDCCELAEDLKESQALFKSIRQDVPNQAMLSTVRARVLDEVAGLEQSSWFERFFLLGFRQKATLAAIALVFVGSGALWMVEERETPALVPPPVVVHVRPVEAPEPPEPVVQAVPVTKPRPRVRRPKPAPIRSETREQVTIKLLTDDPNVIIYWIVDEKGD
jgi:hypothetical protein